MNNKWIKPLCGLVILILACSSLVRIFTAGETLSEYADKNLATPQSGPEDAASSEEENASPSESSTAREGTLKHDLPQGSSDISDESPRTAALTAAYGAGAVLLCPGPSPAADPETSSGMDGLNGTPASGYEKQFFYEPLSEDTIARITGISYPVSEEAAAGLASAPVNTVPDTDSLAVSYDDLRHLSLLYYDFEGEIQTGELICNKEIAQDLLEIFYELFLNEYRIEKIRLIDEYGGDDTASMLDNNTSCFNYRLVDGTDSLSKHALGCAIDINPFYNPYVVFNRNGSGETYISPAGSEIYADRSRDFPYKIDENDLCYRLFTAHGFTWGGNWNSSKDYQHFQKVVG